MLSSKPLSLVATREGEDELQPQGAIYGPKVMIINESAGSGGDYLPWFPPAGVGPLVGKRTWGGLVGLGGVPALDRRRQRHGAQLGHLGSLAGKWGVENLGVAPDVEVEFDPEAGAAGQGPAAGEGGRDRDGGAGQAAGDRSEAAGVSELPATRRASDADEPNAVRR